MAKNKKRKLEPKALPAAAKDPVADDPNDDEEIKHEESEPPVEAEPYHPPPSSSAAAAAAADEPIPAADEPVPAAEEAIAAVDEVPVDQEQQQPEEPSFPDQEDQPSFSAVEDGMEADSEEENDPDSIQKLIDPFSKELLVELLRDAALKHSDVLGEINRIADADPANRKIFVHGLGWDTTRESLMDVFLQYGEIEDCNLVVDKATGKAKGYAFLLYKHRDGARRALRQPQKKIGNRMTACQLASAGPVQPALPPVSEYTQRKIFVSNVAADIDPLKLLQFFSQFGEIEEGPLGLDKVTSKPKGFALFVYKSVEGAKKALEEPHKKFEGHTLHCQKAIDGPKPHKMGYQFQSAGAQIGLSQPSFGGALSSRYPRSGSSGSYGGAANYVSTGGHLMAPSATGLGFNQVAQSAAPALGQAFNAFLAGQGAGLGNLLGTLGSNGLGAAGLGASASSVLNSYGNPTSALGGSMNPSFVGGYGAAGALQGGYANTLMGQGATGRNQSGSGYLGGVGPYIGH